VSERTGRPMALIFLDLDGFKDVNDELGHRTGDGVLQSMARRMNGVVRDADVVGRFGGDEFLVICEDADEAGALHVAHRIAEVVAAPLSEETGMRSITASIGIAVHDPSLTITPTNDAIVRAADAAMYEAKNAGDRRVSIRSI
jgi:diguanylate cyclase (GGDEF)-like protein